MLPSTCKEKLAEYRRTCTVFKKSQDPLTVFGHPRNFVSIYGVFYVEKLYRVPLLP